jgi:hypothetical protein
MLHAYTQVKSDLTAIAPTLALDDVADSVPAGSSVTTNPFSADGWK